MANKKTTNGAAAKKSTVLVNVRYEFSADELQTLGENVALSVEKLLALQDDKKEAMKYHASLIEAAQNEVKTLSRLRAARFEMRDVECNVLVNTPPGKTTVMRCDTKEVVEERDMTDAEKQMPLPINADKPM